MIEDLHNNLQDFFSLVLRLDKTLFHQINSVWTSPFFDDFFKWITDFHRTKYFLVVFGLALIYNMRLRALMVIAGCALSILVADVTAARVIKPLVQRARPQYSETAPRIIVDPQSSFSFPSNHAANAFAAATFLGLAVLGTGPFAMIIAFLISYSRIYVGVHYPLDVVGGGVLGILSGFLIYYFFLAVQNVLFPEALRHLPKTWRKKKYESGRARQI